MEKISTISIDQRDTTNGIIYQINSPNYFLLREYPNNLYCMWNIANDGLVTYQIVDQQLQNATDCDGDSCDCPDFIKIVTGGNELKLCGSGKRDISSQISDVGLQVKFCSDNAIASKGILILAYIYKEGEAPEVDLMDKRYIVLLHVHHAMTQTHLITEHCMAFDITIDINYSNRNDIIYC